MKMIIEAGGTKCRIGLVAPLGLNEFETTGFNPNISPAGHLVNILNEIPSIYDAIKRITKIYYFGAGCGNNQNKIKVFDVLSNLCTHAEIHVKSDLEGSAYSLLHKGEGIIGILGTGASAGYYNGSEIAVQAPSLGYLIGDEGSGAWLGKELVKRVIRKEFDSEIVEAFYQFSGTDVTSIIPLIYSNPQPNAYMAGFVPFLREKQKHPVINQLLTGGFLTYFEKNLKPLLHYSNNERIALTGGIAWHFAHIIEDLYWRNYQLKPVIKRDAFDELLKLV